MTNTTKHTPELLYALTVMVEKYCDLVNSGDAGNWNPETDEAVKIARKAIALVEGKD
jgi:hypothetical protein